MMAGGIDARRRVPRTEASRSRGRTGSSMRISSALVMLGSGLGEMYELDRRRALPPRVHRVRGGPRARPCWYAACLARARARSTAGAGTRRRCAPARLLAQPASIRSAGSARSIALGRVRARRGDPGAQDVLDEALELGAARRPPAAARARPRGARRGGVARGRRGAGARGGACASTRSRSRSVTSGSRASSRTGSGRRARSTARPTGSPGRIALQLAGDAEAAAAAGARAAARTRQRGRSRSRDDEASLLRGARRVRSPRRRPAAKRARGGSGRAASRCRAGRAGNAREPGRADRARARGARGSWPTECGTPRSPSELVLSTTDGRPPRLGDPAQARRAYARRGGRRGVGLGVLQDR